MTTAQLDRPAAVADGRGSRWIRYGTGVAFALGAVLLGRELVGAHLGVELAHIRPWRLAAAVGWIALSLVAAAYNLAGFSAVRIPLRTSLLAQLAISGLRVVTPSAVSTPVVATRFLNRSGASLSDAMATVGAAQGVQLVTTAGVVAGLAAVSGASGSALPDARGWGVGGWGIGAAVVVAVLVVTFAVARRSTRARHVVLEARGSARRLAAHARHSPGRVFTGVVASAALTLTHVLAFAACVSAAGGHLSLLSLAAIYLGGSAAGSLLPTPSGIGGVEAALIAGLTAAGLSVPIATAATLASRLISVWLPAIPGWWAVNRLRRAELL
jgi:uncharacterized membrane protein YbhN (UPF0104 family)